MINRFTVRWVDSESRYKVDVPSWEGGEVVMASAHDALAAELATQRRCARVQAEIGVAQESRIRALYAGLSKYGQHDETCANINKDGYGCTCGLDALTEADGEVDG